MSNKNNNNESTFVFRLQNENKAEQKLQNTLKHWEESNMYGDKEINAIQSTNKKSENQPTSIPSPFARIALVKTAFAEVAEYGDAALKSYQKIVSDTLDVAEIFFTFDRWSNRVEIIRWGKEDLKKLEIGHNQLFKTLNTFLEDDATKFNFDRLQNIYILKYKPTGAMIGATSPSTLFFSSANNMRDVDIALSNIHKAFDGQIIPLSQRSWEFQKYLYTWIYANNESRAIAGRAASSIFLEFQKYLEKQKPIIGRIEEIDALFNNAENNLTEYKELRAPDVEILGKRLHQNNVTASQNLTADDLLESKIIRIPYRTNKDSFFDGNIPDKNKQSFLLPIKEKAFKYFTIDDLRKNLRINQSGDVIEVELSSKNSPVPYKKRYKKSDDTVVDLTFDCALFPNVKYDEDDQAFYRFGVVCDFKDKEKYSADFVKINSKIEDSKKRNSTRNVTDSAAFQLKNYSLEGSNFDYIRLNCDGINGLVIPNMPSKAGEKEFTFAIDFGTTNTHIEYIVDNEKNIRAFDISKTSLGDEKQIDYLHGGDDDRKAVFDFEYTSQYTGDEFKFPTRSALSFGQQTNWNDVYPFEKAGFDELYEKRFGYNYNTTLTDLKWSDNENNQKQAKAYIESIMYLLRNKVILGGGNLGKTKIRWFYPVSMERNRYKNLEKTWEAAYKKYFGGDKENIIPITESIAPFEYYIRDRDASSLVTIDIGGGTTDIVVSAAGGKVDLITSFRFAANTIFGDGYAENARKKNGLVMQFADVIRTELEEKINKNDEIFDIFDKMKTDKSSADLASFLFSLKQNKRVRKAGENLAENANLEKKLIDDTTQTITFVFFYSAIIYHLAKLMKAKNMQIPDKIVFSGNGSRVISFFTEDSEILRNYTRLIFAKVYDSDNQSKNLEIIVNKENPKEATCKGGIFINEPESYSDIFKKKAVLHSNGSGKVFQRPEDSGSEIRLADTYEAVDPQYLNHTVKEAREFINFVFDRLPFFSNEGFSINRESVEIARQTCFEKLDIHAKTGWQLKEREIAKTEGLEETLFFYPLVGMIKDLCDAIYAKNSVKSK